MKYFFCGTDEAGYGPNLGPLSVSASLWSAEFPRSEDPLSLLNKRAGSCFEDKKGFRICDSKKLYHSGRLAPLERSFFYAYETVASRSDELPLFRESLKHEPVISSPWLDIFRSFSASPESERKFIPPWEQESVFSLPLTTEDGWLESFAIDREKTNARLEQEGISLFGIRSRRVQPHEFNLLVDRLGLKSELLAAVTLQTAQSLIMPLLEESSCEEKEIILCCDKLGGRNRYGDLLTEFFPDAIFQIEVETREVSRYRFPLSRGQFTVIFQAKGESNIPSALASILSKYQREVSMKAFNRYWCKRLSGLKPTAGYPVDAKRFREEVDPIRQAEGIGDPLFWRKK